MAKKGGATAAKSKATTSNGNKKKAVTELLNNNQVSVSSLLQTSKKSQPQHHVKEVFPGHVFVARNFLSQQECQALIEMAETSGEMERMSHAATRYIAQRTCGRWQRNDVDAAKLLFDRMTNILTQMNLDCFPLNYIPVACNANLRLYKYETNMSFGKHYDGSNTVEEGDTEITVLVYLSDCEGGATRFYSPHSKRKSVAFSPEEGAILLHIHGDRCLQHEADAVVSGVKYVLRTDIVYAKQP
jgi:hypothetical protein